MPTKVSIIKKIESMPDEFSMDELIDRILFMEKVEEGIKEAENGEVTSESDLDHEIRKWFK